MAGHTARVRAGNDRASLYTEITLARRGSRRGAGYHPVSQALYRSPRK